MKGSCFKQDETPFNHGKVIKIYIVYKINKHFEINSYPTLENCLFGEVELTTHCDFDLCKYSIYGIGFYRKGSFSLGNEIGRNVITFGVDISSSPYIDNKKKNILTPGKSPTQGLEHTLTATKLHSINFTENNKKFCLSLHCNGRNSYFFVNGTGIQRKLSEI